MFQGFSNETYEFFMAIRFNNNRDFFQANKDWYARAVREPMLELAQAVAPTLTAIDDEMDLRPGRCVARVNRDIRFARDKSPYKDYTFMKFRRPSGDESAVPGFYFDMSDNGASCGMGIYQRNMPLMNALRRQLVVSPDAFLSMAGEILRSFRLCGDEAKRMKIPEGLRDEARVWYPLRGFYLERDLDDFALLKSPALVDALCEAYRAVAPMYRYLRELVSTDN